MIGKRTEALLAASATIYAQGGVEYSYAVDSAYALLGLILEREKAQYGSREAKCGGCSGKFCADCRVHPAPTPHEAR